MLRKLKRNATAGGGFIVLCILLYLYLSENCTISTPIFLQPNVKEQSSHAELYASQAKVSRRSATYKYSWPKCERNISMSNVTDFGSLPRNIQDFLYHRHCLHFPMLLDNPDKCGGPEGSAEVFLLLVIKSAPPNHDRREMLRKTWAKDRLYNGVWIRRIFISGTMGSGPEKRRLNKLLELEQQKYGDILQWDFSDTFYNLTLKQVLFLEWTERNCPGVRFMLNGDDDVFAHTENMVLYLQSLEDNDGSKHLFTGHLIHYVGPIRDRGSKYFVPVQVHESESYPPYCGGGGYILSGYTAMVIYNMSQSITLIPIDDVYFGMCMEKAGLGPESHPAVKTAGLHIPNVEDYDPCYYKEMLLVHRVLSENMYLLWERIHGPNLKCFGSS
ncbi:N-acetyllactosaminide beta-1,3-N-acetylglucosaminyltransferase 3-like [Cololabis saira]|uniref:N-acetyllactosaminide beta-1,3-N-acetylglucosaminyltransferase 3-like n=1 Tax=Cololabis saira TaxID=129043 RepID=UPI002AD26059|nr:N-acetyllactosaminide beta-1,3-N-acetylglucosaminyltransferase 3-like [Cololabis saira]